MYEAFYGMQIKPFNLIPNPELVFESKRHLQALTYLNYALADDIGFVMITGEAGTGKTTLLRHFLAKTRPNIDTAVVFNTNVSGFELLQFILREFEIDPIPQSKVECISMLNEYCIQNYSKKRHTMLVIDEAQNLSREALEELRLLSNLQSSNHSLLQIILTGQPDLQRIILSPGLEQLAQRISVRYHLTAMDRDETGDYIRFRLNYAETEDIELFSEAAIDLIYDYSQGIARTINTLCNTALVYGFADELPKIDEEVIKQVLEDNGKYAERPEGDHSDILQFEPSTNNENYLVGSETLSSHFWHEHTTHGKDIHAIKIDINRLTDRVAWLEAHQPETGSDDRMLKALTALVDKERARYEQLQRHTVRLEQEIISLRKLVSEQQAEETSTKTKKKK